MSGSSNCRDPSARRVHLLGVVCRVRNSPLATGESGRFINSSHVGSSLDVGLFLLPVLAVVVVDEVLVAVVVVVAVVEVLLFGRVTPGGCFPCTSVILT